MKIKTFRVGIILLSALVIALLIVFIAIALSNPYPVKFKEEISYISAKYEVQPALIAGVVFAESSYNAQVVSSKGAVGLMQIMPETAKWLCEKLEITYSAKMLENPLYNLELGTYYLSYLLNKFQISSTALAAYNAGEGKTKIWLENSAYSINGKEIKTTPYPQTNAYISKVLKAQKYYSKIYK